MDEFAGKIGMKMKRRNGWLPVHAINLMVIVALCVMGSPALIFAEVSAPYLRHIDLDGQSNFRDIGGYKTVDSHSIKWSIVYREPAQLPGSCLVSATHCANMLTIISIDKTYRLLPERH